MKAPERLHVTDTSSDGRCGSVTVRDPRTDREETVRWSEGTGVGSQDAALELAKARLRATDGITIVSIEAENFHRLRVAQVEYVPGRGLVRVTGKNKAGKTSLLRLVAGVLGGAANVRVTAENTDAEGEGWSGRLTLSNGFRIGRRSTPSNPKGVLDVIGPDGGKHNQSKVDEWLGDKAFDLMAFYGLSPDRQREILLSLGGDPELGAKLDDLKAERAALQEERTPWIRTQQKVSRMAPPEGERPEPVDVSAEMERLGELEAQERERTIAWDDATDAANRLREREAEVASSRDRIAELQRLLKEEQQNLTRLQNLADRARVEWQDASGNAEELPDPSGEIAEVRARIRQADAVNAALEPWREWDRAQREKAEAASEVAALNERIRETEEQEHLLLQDAGIPIPGLAFGEGGEPLLNGLPLEDASGAERIDLAVSVAMAVNPQLRVCLVDEGNDLDLEALERLDLRAKAEGFQVFLARLGLEGPGEIVVEDGEARAAELEF